MQTKQTKAFDYIICNAQIATMSAALASDKENDNTGYGILSNSWVGVKDGLITYLGAPLDDFKAHEIIDGKGHWLTPGLIDCHTHLIYGGNRSNEFEMRLNGASYQEIAQAGGGILSTVKSTRQASRDELFSSAAKRLQNFIAEGVTTIEIKSGYGLDTDNEIKMLEVAQMLENQFPVRVRKTFLGAHALPPEYANNSDDYIKLICEEMLPKIIEQNLADSVDVFCEEIGFSYQQTEIVYKAAQRLGLQLKLHAEQLTDQSGAGLAADYDALSADHLEYLSLESINKMATSDTVAVLLPGAFYFLRETKLPPVQELRNAQVPIAIASDSNPGSSPVQSLLLMLNMACTLFKMTPLEALQGVTINAAKALGLDREIGSIEINKKAEMVLWDIEHPNELSYQFGVNPRVRTFN